MTDTEKLIHDLRQLGKYSSLEPNWLRLAADKIEELSKRVEVIRCCECKECEIIYPIKAIYEEPEPLYYCNLLQAATKPTDFCSYGERKGDGE